MQLHLPETLRWVGKLPALALRHDRVVAEMISRGYNHRSPFPRVDGESEQHAFLISLAEQEDLLRAKDCDCLLET